MNPQEKLQRAAELVVQERKMMLLSYKELSRIYPDSNAVDAVEKNAYLESFLIHYRNILDFLEPRKSAGRDDVKAADFYPDHEAKKPPIEHRKPIDKRLAHISYKRLDVPIENKPWPILTMLDKIEKTWESFKNDLADHQEDRSDWFGPQTASEAAAGESHIEIPAGGVVSASTSRTEIAVFYTSSP